MKYVAMHYVKVKSTGQRYTPGEVFPAEEIPEGNRARLLEMKAIRVIDEEAEAPAAAKAAPPKREPEGSAEENPDPEDETGDDDGEDADGDDGGEDAGDESGEEEEPEGDEEAAPPIDAMEGLVPGSEAAGKPEGKAETAKAKAHAAKKGTAGKGKA